MPQSEVRFIVKPRTDIGAFNVDTKLIPVDVGDETGCVVFLDVIKNGGTFMLSVDLITKDPGSGNWVELDSFPTISTTGTRALRVSNTLGLELAIQASQSNGNGDITWQATLGAKG